MRLFKDRPLAFFSAVFVLTSIFAIELPPEYKPALITVSLLSVIFYCVCGLLIKRKSVAVKKLIMTFISAAAAVALSAGTMYLTVDRQLLTAEALIGKSASVEAVITEVRSENVYSGYYLADILTVGGESSELRARLETEFSVDLEVGDIVTAYADFHELNDDGAYDLKTNSFRRGVTVHARVEGADALKVTGKRENIFLSIEALRERISAMLSVSAEMSGGDCGLMGALFIGERTNLDGVVRRDFAYTGISHLLAVSGMHLTVLIGGLEALLKKLTLHKTPRTLILIAATVFYMGLTGFSAAILRAGIMLMIYQLSYFMGREADGVTSLFVTVFLIILVSPFSASDIGLLLSFAAMLACIAASESTPKSLTELLVRLSSRGGIFRPLSELIKLIIMNFMMSVYAMLFTLPVMWHSFGRMSLLSPIGTVLLFLPITVILYLIPFVIISYRIPILLEVFAYPAAWLSRITVKAAAILASFDGAELLLPISEVISTTVLFAIVVCIISAIALPKRASRAAICLAATIFTALSVSSVYYRETSDENSVFYLNNSKNEAFAVSDGANSLVIDISNGGTYITSTAVEYAREKLRSDVDAYMLTHLHRRHIKSLEALLETEYISCVYLPHPSGTDTALYEELATLASEYGAEVITYEYEKPFSYGDVTIDTASAFIERSSQPTQLLTFVSEDVRTTYIGSAVHESELFPLALDVCRNSEKIIFGIHGPNMKTGADYFITESQTVTYASDGVKALFSEYLSK